MKLPYYQITATRNHTDHMRRTKVRGRALDLAEQAAKRGYHVTVHFYESQGDALVNWQVASHKPVIKAPW